MFYYKMIFVKTQVYFFLPRLKLLKSFGSSRGFSADIVKLFSLYKSPEIRDKQIITKATFCVIFSKLSISEKYDSTYHNNKTEIGF